MKIQPIASYNQTTASFYGYHNLSKKILNSDRKELINLAEFFHTSSENELKEITGSNEKAYALLKEAIEGVITRKKCYLADGSSFAAKRAEELDKKAVCRNIYLKG